MMEYCCGRAKSNITVSNLTIENAMKPLESVDELQPYVLIYAYQNGYFPMPHPQNGQILWFSPDPRAIIPLNNFHISHSLGKKLRQKRFEITLDQDFPGVIANCADREETWIDERISNAYFSMFDLGLA